MIEIKAIIQSNVPTTKIIGPRIAAIMVVMIAEMLKYNKLIITIHIPSPNVFR